MNLFHKPLRQALDARFQQHQAQIENYSLQELKNPALAGAIEQKWRASMLKVPRLRIAERTGRTAERAVVRSDYGRAVPVKETIIIVTVPMLGDWNALIYKPSSCFIIHEKLSVAGGQLTYEMPADPEAEPRYDKLLKTIEQNLENMRAEEDLYATSAIDHLRQIANARREKLESEEQLKKKFSFPIK